MKNLLLISIVLLFTGCNTFWIKYPERMEGESSQCFRARECRYMAAVSKNSIDCSLAQAKCSKLENMEYCSKGKGKLSFQSCWDKLD